MESFLYPEILKFFSNEASEMIYTLYRDDAWELGFQYNELFRGTYEECLEHILDHKLDYEHLFIENEDGDEHYFSEADFVGVSE